jgi:hypothetical protein
LQQFDPARVLQRKRGLTVDQLLTDAARTRRSFERAIAAFHYLFVVLHGKPRFFQNLTVDVMFFAECTMAEGRLLRVLMGGKADFLWVWVGGICRRGLFLGTLLLLDAVRIFLYDFGIDGVVLAEGELLMMRGGFGIAREEVLGVGNVLAADGRLDHPWVNNFIKQQR